MRVSAAAEVSAAESIGPWRTLLFSLGFLSKGVSAEKGFSSETDPVSPV